MSEFAPEMENRPEGARNVAHEISIHLHLLATKGLGFRSSVFTHGPLIVFRSLSAQHFSRMVLPVLLDRTTRTLVSLHLPIGALSL